MVQVQVSSEYLPVPGSDVYSLQETEWKTSGTVVDVAHAVYDNHYQLLIITNESDSDLYLTQDRKSVITRL